MVDATELEVLCLRNVLREVAAAGHLHDMVAVPVQHQCGHPDRRKDRAHVDLGIHSQETDRCSRACAHPLAWVGLLGPFHQHNRRASGPLLTKWAPRAGCALGGNPEA